MGYLILLTLFVTFRAGVKLFSWMGQDMLFPHVVRILVTFATGVVGDHTLCHIQCRSRAFLLNGPIHALFPCWWMSRLICCKSGAFLLSGLIHADHTFLHIQCRSRAFLLCWQISCHICCKSRATFMSVGASICPQTGQTGKIGFRVLKS